MLDENGKFKGWLIFVIVILLLGLVIFLLFKRKKCETYHKNKEEDKQGDEETKELFENCNSCGQLT